MEGDDGDDVRNDAKRQRKVFQDFRKEKDELPKRFDSVRPGGEWSATKEK